MAPRGLATVLRRLPAERRFAASRVPATVIRRPRAGRSSRPWHGRRRRFGPEGSGPRSPAQASSPCESWTLITPGLGGAAAFPRTRPLDRIAPAPLNIATALHAEAIRGVSLDARPPGK